MSIPVLNKAFRFALMTIVLCVLPTLRAADGVPPEVVSAGNAGLLPFLNQIPVEDLERYGFTSTNEFSRCSLGTPLRIYTISPERILDFDGSGDLLSMLIPTGDWICPVMADGRSRVLLTVTQLEQAWTAVAIGGAGLAGELAETVKQWPITDGYEHFFVRVFQARSDFLVVHGKGTAVMVPLGSAMRALNLPSAAQGGGSSSDYTDVIQRLKASVEQSLGDKQ